MHDFAKNIIIEFPFAVDRIFDVAKQVSRGIKGYKYVSADDNDKSIRLSTGINLWTFGEHVAIRITRVDDEHSSVEVSSRPKAPITIFDYGRNRRNINNVLSALTAALPQA